ncbi:MAG: multifunctional oxoglutarate decarboxylase/oxoglutarate dehydrogenase thiamine pyrophosphate-binding subunit/dihydrolipoyllysine-residue succinyltransferase subunit, partial [Actinobacteria bacterium]|nr:multifunctional oxoglutarate decarboxylase/oxoglutarate dehydrogenase thiamine pyrophosphate-binding subunit/dihydrolipoyllysine-residue succinyltransferase subunit [Actinomycetota bacterium]
MVERSSSEDFGANSWLVEEMYERYRDEPETLSAAWRDFFSDYMPVGSPKADPTGELVRLVTENLETDSQTGVKASESSVKSVSQVKQSVEVSKPAVAQSSDTKLPVVQTPIESVVPEPLRGVSAVIAANMQASLEVPTATSVRQVPAKLLEVNRKVINGYRGRSGESKVSFTHLIGYAIVRAIADSAPSMKHVFSVDDQGKPQIQKFTHVNMGLAVDVDKGNGQRSLVVPVLRNADTLDFFGFLLAYEDIIRKVRANKLGLEDFKGANISLTNPGTIGTQQSVPRLMVGQGVIVGVGSIDYPAEFQGSDQRTLGRLGVSKVVTITSTYDHRIIQGAESGRFLKYVHELLIGEHNFYADVFSSLGVPYQAVQWREDSNSLDSEDALLEKQMQIATLIRVHRVRGHLIADLDPLHWRAPEMPRELDPATYGLTLWDLDREFLTGGVGGVSRSTLGELLGVLRDAYCRTIGVEYMHIHSTEEQRWIQERFEGHGVGEHIVDQHRVLERLNAAEAFERFLATKYVGTKRFGLEGAESLIPMLDVILSSSADNNMHSAVIGAMHRGRLNVLANIMNKDLEEIFEEFEDHIDPSSVQGSGDVKYHLGSVGVFASPKGGSLPIELSANPSHLETVGPIVLG